MKTSLRGRVSAAFWLFVASLLSPSLFASLPPAFTPKELAQGYSDTAVLARPRDGDDASASSAETREGLTVRQRFPRFGNLRVLRVPTGETVQQTTKRLRATGRYAYVEPDRILHHFATPNDPSFSQQWALNNTGAGSGVAGADIGAVTAWDTLNDASSVVVAIVDSGARLTHNDLSGNLWSSTDSGHVGTHGISAVGGNGTISSYDPNDTEVGHGTHVSGIIGAVGNNGTGIAGVAWKTQLMELRYLHGDDGSGSTSDSLTCLQFAIDHGAKIINASYGSSISSSAELEALKKVRDAGIIFVAAAGNDSSDNDTIAAYPASYPLDNIVSVASTKRTDALSSFSDYGSGSVDLAAPGESIYSTWITSDTANKTESGTSMAAPHVSGALALLRAKFPNDTYRQLINRLLRSTTPLSALAGKVQTGGRLNLAAAITSTDNRPFNDDFSTRATLSGDNIRVRSSNVGATVESGEPAHAGVTPRHTLWWSWTATASTLVTLTTTGSKVPVSGGTDTTLDTTLAVYTGSAVNALAVVASNDDNGTATTSRLDLNVTAGTTYHIAVDGKNGATGYIALNLGAVPGNDNFSAAKTLTGLGVRESGTTLNAGRESGEPNPTSQAAGHSVWYKWTAPASTRVSLAAFATTTDTVAAVYTGTSVSTLTLVSANDNNANSDNTDALAAFNATASTTYYFQIDHTSDSVDGGAFILTLTDSLWEFPAFDEISGPAAVATDGTVYFGAGTLDNDTATDTSIYAVNPDGSKKWSYVTDPSGTGTGIVNGGPAVGSDGTVYLGSSDGKLYALRAATGSLKWTYDTGDTAIGCTPAIATDGTIYVRGSTQLFALTDRGSSATVKWSYTLNSAAYTTYASPVIGADGTIYVATGDTDATGKLYALTDNGTSAATKWTYSTDGQIYTTPAIAADGTLYLGTLTGAFYALTPGTASATKKWSIALASYAGTDNSITSSPALAADGTIYFAAYDHKLYALNPSTGATRWTYTLGDEVRACSPALASDGTIYIGAYDGSVSAVSSTGGLVRTYPAAKRVRSSPVIAGNRLYFGSADAKLHAFDLGQTNLASPWPMFHQNAARLGRAASGAITLSAQSSSRTAVVGSSVTLSVTATSGATLSYQWYKNGRAISGATSASYTISGVSAADTATYTVVVASNAGSVTSDPITLTVVASGTLPSNFADIATRAYCSTGNNVTIGGFVIAGSSPKRVLIRAVGPSLTAQGIAASEVLLDPVIEVHDAINHNDIVASNDDSAKSAEIATAISQVGATALLASDTKSSELLLTLAPGVYSFIVKGQNASSGIVLLEVYDADGSGSPSRFTNISSRADCTTGNGVAIGGFVITGTLAKTVLVRAVGPSLTTMTAGAITTAEALADPKIELHLNRDGVDSVIATNNNWTDNADAIRTNAARIGATPLESTDTTSAAILKVLQPGVYSFIITGQNNITGIVLVEVYDAD